MSHILLKRVIQLTLSYPELFYPETSLPGQDFQNGHVFTTALTTLRHPDIRYPEDIFKVPKVQDK